MRYAKEPGSEGHLSPLEPRYCVEHLHKNFRCQILRLAGVARPSQHITVDLGEVRIVQLPQSIGITSLGPVHYSLLGLLASIPLKKRAVIVSLGGLVHNRGNDRTFFLSSTPLPYKKGAINYPIFYRTE